ncbi:hypothetical protein C8R43DRAFT_1125688 [Mycena crocata]|nr:hypothetical protein C8R43DRAFT_1125688 [Mycena crocata]
MSFHQLLSSLRLSYDSEVLSDALSLLMLDPEFLDVRKVVPVSLVATLDFPLSYDLWLKIIVDLVHNPLLTPKESASARAVAACVSRGWHTAVSTTPVLWSTITIYPSVSISRLQFVLSRCNIGDLHLRLVFRATQRLHGQVATTSDILRVIDSVFHVLSPMSHRWKSFHLIAENPSFYGRIHSHCQDLRADFLSTIELAYVYLPGYPAMSDSDDTVPLPFRPNRWFAGSMSSVRRATAFCASFDWTMWGLLDNLDEVEISDYSLPNSLDSSFIPLLISSAGRLRVLRLGALRPFQIPTDRQLRSYSIRVLDVEFGPSRFMTPFMASLDVPNLEDLMVRSVADSVHCLLTAPLLLSRLRAFRARAHIGDDHSLRQLFTSLPMLSVLDLRDVPSVVFTTYCDWAYSRLRFNQSNYAANLRELYLGIIDGEEVLRLATFVAQTVVSDVRRVGIRFIMADISDDVARDGEEITTAAPPAPRIFVEVLEIILSLVSDRAIDYSIKDFIEIRSALRLSDPFINELVEAKPAFWSRLIVTPSAPIPYIESAILRARAEALHILFDASGSRSGTYRTFGYVPWGFYTYLHDALQLLRHEIGRCEYLGFFADTTPLLEDVLTPMSGSNPTVLGTLEVAFQCRSLFDIRPYAIAAFAFNPASPFGTAFPPVYSIAWKAGHVVSRTITYTTSSFAHCCVVQPAGQSVTWADALQVVTSSTDLSVLILDGITFAPATVAPVSTFPLHALRVLEFTINGEELLVYLICRFNIPSIHTVNVKLTYERDLRTLLRCSGLLANAKEVSISGVCPLIGGIVLQFLTGLTSVQFLDLRGASYVMFETLFTVSRLPPPLRGPHYNALPHLRGLKVAGISLGDLQSLILQRQSRGLPKIDTVVAEAPEDGVDEDEVSWFLLNIIELGTPTLTK